MTVINKVRSVFGYTHTLNLNSFSEVCRLGAGLQHDFPPSLHPVLRLRPACCHLQKNSSHTVR